MNFEPRFLYLEMKVGLDDPWHSLLQNVVPGVLNLISATLHISYVSLRGWLWQEPRLLSNDLRGDERKGCDRSDRTLPKVTAAWYSYTFRISSVQGHSPLTEERDTEAISHEVSWVPVRSPGFWSCLGTF